jgi:hypothetical protein
MNVALIVLRVLALVGPPLAGLALRLSALGRGLASMPSSAPTATGQERRGSTLPRAAFFAGGLAFCLALCLPLLAPGLGTADLEQPVLLVLALAGLVLVALGTAVAGWARLVLGDQPEFLPTRRGFDRYFGLPRTSARRCPCCATRRSSRRSRRRARAA